MKTKTKILLLILILLVSIMAIIITANQIYNILSNDKIIDNNVNGIDGEENTYKEGEEDIFNESNPKAVVNWNPFPGIYPPSFPKVYYSEWVVVGNTRTRVMVNVQYAMVSRRQSLNTHIKDETTEASFLYNLRMLNLDSNASVDYEDNESTPIEINNSTDFENSIFQNVPTSEEILQYSINQFNITGFNYEYTYKTNILNFSFYFVSYAEIYRDRQTQTNGEWGGSNLTELFTLANKSCTLNITAITYNIESNSISLGSDRFMSVESNELLQVDTKINDKKISQYMYEQITSNYQWGRGKELATILCSIGEYYNEDGELAISVENNNLPMIFNIGDYVIPYIPAAGGKTAPMSMYRDGTPKVFKVTQVRPYFDGACWQEIMLQEVKK